MLQWTGRIPLQIRGWVPCGLLVLWVGMLLLVPNPGPSLMAYDEGWYAQQARWIVETGDWVTQHWWYQPLYDRAMGLQWLIALSYSLFGVSVTVARLPSALACLASVLLLYGIGTQVMPRSEAWLGAAILAVTPIWMQAAGLATQDVPLICLELLTIWSLLQSERHPSWRRSWGLVAGGTIGLAFTIKSFMIVPFGVALLPYLLLEHPRHRHLTNPGLYLGLVLGFMPTFIWWGLSIAQYGWFPLKQLFSHLFYLSEHDYHRAGAFYYFWNLPVTGFPWPLLAIPGIGIVLQSNHYKRRLLWLGYPAVLFVELTLFTTRTWYYGMQLLPWVALLASVTLSWLGRGYTHPSRWRRRWPTYLSWLLAGIGLLLIVTGIAILLDPSRLPLEQSWAYGVIGIGMGLGWLIPAVADALNRRHPPIMRSAWLWQMGWLAGLWLGIAMLYATSLWGRYDEGIKTRLEQPPFASVLADQSVDFWLSPENRPVSADMDLATLVHQPYHLFLEDKDVILLTVNTPHQGRAVLTPDDVRPHSLLWVKPEQARQIPLPHDVIGQIDGWDLVRVKGEE